MSRAAETEVPTDRRLYDAAVRLFAERGYHGTSVREIVGSVGVQPAAFYYHYPSKEHLLREIMSRTLEELTAAVAKATAGVEPLDQRLLAALHAHITFHALHPLEAFVTDSELRALPPADRKQIVRLRDRYESIFTAILDEGAEAGEFLVHDAKVETYALMALATAVATWYSPRGRLSVARVAEIYGSLVLDGVRRR